MFGFLLITGRVLLETVEQLLYRTAGRDTRRYVPLIAMAIILHLCGMAVWYALLKFLPLGIALPLCGLSYATIALASRYFFAEKVSVRRWLGIAFIIAGFALISLREAP
jgi:drug/metabolite transporter (DMT)-like permease